MKKQKRAVEIPLTHFQQLLSGGIAGLIADSVSYPLDTIRARIVMQKQVKLYNYRGTFHALKTVLSKEGGGYLSLYKGYPAVLCGTFPGHGLYFYTYEFSKRKINKLLGNGEDSQKSNFLVSMMSGLLADFAGSFAWCPMEVIKQNAMVWTNKSLMEVVGEIRKYEGFSGFYRGYFAGIWTFAPFVMLNFAFYEKFKHFESKILKRDVDDLPNWAHFVGAVGSSYLSSFLTTPFCVGRTRIQCMGAEKKNTNLFKEMFGVIKNEGASTLVEVWKTRSLWFALNTATTFMCYEFMKKSFRKKKKRIE